MESVKLSALRELNLLDKFLFDEAMEDRETYQMAVSILMENEVEFLEKPETEKELRVSSEIRQVRLDVVGMDKKGNILLKLQGRIDSRELKVAVLSTRIAGARDLKAAEERVRCQITKYQMCLGCLACESVCKYNALMVKETKTGQIAYCISEDKCLRCGACVNHFTGGCYMRKVLSVKRG